MEERLEELIRSYQKNVEALSAEELGGKYRRAFARLKEEIEEVTEGIFLDILLTQPFFSQPPTLWEEAAVNLWRSSKSLLMALLYQEMDVNPFLLRCHLTRLTFFEECFLPFWVKSISSKNGETTSSWLPGFSYHKELGLWENPKGEVGVFLPPTKEECEKSLSQDREELQAALAA